MKSKFLITIAGLLFIVACGSTYLVYGAYSKYSDEKKTTNKLNNVEIDRTSQDVPASERYATEYVDPELKLTAKEVYEYGQSEFNSLTNFGENYIPEKHDELVIKKTADYFGIDYETANQLYLEGATGINIETKSIFNSNTENPSKMTMELFKLLKPHMTYEEVKTLTKLEGILDPNMSTSNGIESYKYKGTGHSQPSLVYFDGKLASATQAGLIKTPALSLEGYAQLVKGMSLSDVISLLGEGEYTGFSSSPNNPLITSYSYKLNHHYIDFNFLDGYLYEVPTLPTN